MAGVWLVPLRFRREIGVVTGLVGAAGGLGGFFLPSLLGSLRDLTGTYASGLAVLAALCLWGMSLIVAVSGAWRLTWATSGPLAAPALSLPSRVQHHAPPEPSGGGARALASTRNVAVP